jgi:hypothetical protein
MKSVKDLKIIFAVLLFSLTSHVALTDEVMSTTINTSSLPVTPGSEVVFELNDGSGLGDANNKATLSSFSLGGGLAGAVDAVNSMGGYSGNLVSGVALTDSSFTNLFAQFFSAGSTLSFTLDLTTNVDAGGTPDQFSMFIYDPRGNPMATTTDPTGFNSLLTINVDSSSPTANNYAPNLVTVTRVTPVPEPGTLLLLGSCLMSLGLLRRKVSSHSRSFLDRNMKQSAVPE